jgi:hypothetical protein
MRIKMPATMANTPIVVPLIVILFLATESDLLRFGLMLILLIFKYSVNINIDLTGGCIILVGV